MLTGDVFSNLFERSDIDKFHHLGMTEFVNFVSNFKGILCKRLYLPTQTLTLAPIVVIARCFHCGTNPSGFSNQSLNSNNGVVRDNVAIFWDLDNKPPKFVSPFDAAERLKKAAASFGVVRYMLAYANQCSFNYVPPDVREKRNDRKVLNQLENRGVLRPDEPYKCHICGRKFYNNERFVNHFRQIHKRENAKRLNRIESARGSKKVKLVGKYSMKMEKYTNVARDVLTPKVGYGLGDELKRAGFWVRKVLDKPQAADIALRNHMVDVMDKRRAECVVLVSDDSDFVEVLEEAKLRCLKTVVVGDINDGALTRVSDVSFSWKEIMLGKVRKEEVLGIGLLNYRDGKRILCGSNGEDDYENQDSDFEGFISGEDENDDDNSKDNYTPWWKLDSDTNVSELQNS